MSNKLTCILMVDDDKATNFLNRRLLNKMELSESIHVARNGAEAMDYLSTAVEGLPDCPCPDLILLDINMPLINGWEFLEHYQEMPEDFKNRIRILILTTSLRDVDVERAKSTPGVKGFLSKPLREGDIKSMLNLHFAL
ncbi:MAG: response regulator [Saprospiraceae bacterium]|nr:response regulator [Saprospiraceae bacterium]